VGNCEGLPVAYSVRTVDEVKSYLRAFTGLSRAGRLKLLGGYLDNLREHGDTIRSDPSARHPQNSSLFFFTYIFRDGGRTYVARFLVDDSAAAYGVLTVVYADCWSP
jgi:hypothetical protein